MTRSTKKPYVWITPRTDKHKRSAERRPAKQQCHEVEIAFGPDEDYDVYTDKREFGSWGTWFGFPIANLLDDDLDDDDRESIVTMSRK